MNKKIIIAVVGALIIFALFFVRVYTSSPGFVTGEMMQEFYRNLPKCHGIDLPLNGRYVVPDAQEKNLCIGILTKPGH